MSFLQSARLRLRELPYHVAAAVLLLGLGAWFYLPYLTTMPTGIHAWAQGDRLALAINFYDYGFDFWHPRTSSLVSIGGITGVEFPLQAYLAAMAGAVFGREAINPAFRLIDVACTLVGFFYLFRLVFERTGHFVAGLVPACFLLSSPVFCFYAGNYLPDPASLSLSFVGYYYWLRFFERRVFRDLAVAVAVLTLAALIKTTTALFLASVLGITLGWEFLQPGLLTLPQRRWFAALAVAGVGLIVAFFFHNLHLNTYYQSWQFLAELRPVKDTAMLHEIVRAVHNVLWREYATLMQYHVLLASGVLLLVFARHTLRRYLPLVLLLLLALGIAYVFFWQMGSQLLAHDYYIIAAFGPAAVLLLLLALVNLGRFGGYYRWATSLALGILAFAFVRDGYSRWQQRMSEPSYAWLQDARVLLAQHQVPLTANVFILGEEAINTPLVYADRRGRTLAVPPTDASLDLILKNMAADSLEYVLMPRPYYDALPDQAALRAACPPVMEQPFVVLRRLDMKRSW